jgi:hypothetical protein
VADVLGEIDLLGGPEGGFGLLVHFPDLRVLDREHAEPVRVRSEQWLFGNGRHFLWFLGFESEELRIRLLNSFVLVAEELEELGGFIKGDGDLESRESGEFEIF